MFVLGFIPSSFGEWATLVVFVLTIFVMIIVINRKYFASHRFKRLFVKKKDIISVLVTVINKSTEEAKDIEPWKYQKDKNHGPMLGGAKTVINYVYFIQFKSKDNLITLNVSEKEYKIISLEQKGTLKYYRSYFIEFM